MINNETLTIACGLGSAAAWGAGDFSGGLASRKGNLLGVVLISQFFGGLILAALALLLSETIPPFKAFFYGGLAGICGIFGLIALYRGLAQGRMGIVAPLSAVLTALMPIGYTAFFEGLPTIAQSLGFVCFVVAVWLLSSAEAGLKMTKNEFFLSLAAGLGFGFFFIFIDQANDQAIFWPLVGARFASVSLLLIFICMRKKRASTLKGQWILIGITGVLDAAGNALFSMAAHFGRLDIAAVLGSLYPAATVLLAWFFLKELLRPQQWAGVCIAFAALILLSV